jgi:hypothetical protein
MFVGCFGSVQHCVLVRIVDAVGAGVKKLEEGLNDLGIIIGRSTIPEAPS